MELNLKIDYLYSNQKENAPFWWKESTIIEEIIERILQNDLVDFRYFWANDTFTAFDKIESLSQYYKKFYDKHGCFFSLTKDKTIDDNYIQFYCSGDCIGINLSIDVDFSVNQLQLLQQLALDIYNDHEDKVIFGPCFLIEVHGVSYPRFRPLKDYKGLREHSLINFLQPLYFSSDKNLVLRQDEKLLTLPLAKGVSSKELNGLHIIQWTDKLESEAQIRQVLMDREDFIYKNFDLEPINGFNEFGDKIIFGISQLPAAPEGENFYTYYNEKNGMAFKLLTLNENLEIDSDTMDRIKSSLEMKKLSTGQALNSVTLLLPSRKTATAIENFALANGIYKVLYLDNDTNVWDMRPKGDWRN